MRAIAVHLLRGKLNVKNSPKKEKYLRSRLTIAKLGAAGCDSRVSEACQSNRRAERKMNGFAFQPQWGDMIRTRGVPVTGGRTQCHAATFSWQDRLWPQITIRAGISYRRSIGTPACNGYVTRGRRKQESCGDVCGKHDFPFLMIGPVLAEVILRKPALGTPRMAVRNASADRDDE
jgi:hypothetical protein